LENVLARAVILSDGPAICVEELGLPGVVTPQGATPIPEGTRMPYHDSMEAHSRWLITEALRRTGWNQTQAAASLKLQRTYLTKLMKQKIPQSHQRSGAVLTERIGRVITRCEYGRCVSKVEADETGFLSGRTFAQIVP
jgi:hypothetical protein